MKSKFLMKAGSTLVALSLLLGFVGAHIAHATNYQLIVDSTSTWDSTDLTVIFTVLTGGTSLGDYEMQMPIGTWNTELDFTNAVKSAVIAYANTTAGLSGVTTSNIYVQEPAHLSSTYQAFVTQSGTSAPSATQFINDFPGTTFTWARTGTGTYTLTASSAVFTANKTAVLMSNPPSFLNNYKYTVTSSTVITFQTASLSVVSLLLTTGNADALLSNTMIYVVVYP